MSQLNKNTYPVKWLRVKNLSVRWVEAQRGLDNGHVKTIMDDFDPDKFGTVAVTTENGDGRRHIVDGQHRVEAVRRMWGKNERVPCQIIPAGDPEEAAEAFLGINKNRKKLNAIEKFHVAVTAGHEDQVAVDKLLRDMGYKVAMGQEDGTISAITACMNTYNRLGLDGLKRTLLLLRGTWGIEREAYHNSIIRGYTKFLREHGEDCDDERLVKKVKEQETPASLLAAARTARDMLDGSLAMNVRRVLVKDYNHNLAGQYHLKEQI